mmetsp:Transcript_60591/g.180191  ORF Transcript_60591/g.180191 Transcript_60591/m.180191 type:complete len:297 (+) Transcript_60591:944-1834(+)
MASDVLPANNIRSQRTRATSAPEVPEAWLRTPILSGDEHLSTIYYPVRGSLHIYPQGCDGPHYTLRLVAGDLLVFHTSLCHAGPSSEHCTAAPPTAKLSVEETLTRVHSVVLSHALPYVDGGTDRCQDHEDAGGTGWRAAADLPQPTRAQAIAASLADVPALLARQGYVVLPAEQGAPHLNATELAWIDRTSALPSGSQAWRPIFNSTEEEEVGFSLRQIHPVNATLAKWQEAHDESLRSAGLLQQAASGPFSGRDKWLHKTVLLRSCPGCPPQCTHADFALEAAALQYGVLPFAS